MTKQGKLSDLSIPERPWGPGTVGRGGNGGVGSAPSQATTKIYTHWLSQRESFTAFLGKTDN